MMSRPIPQHLWALVLPHLLNPIPPPLSAPDDRSTLRQSALACVSRVSRLFKAESYKLLYKHIITDDLPTLFRDFQIPSVRQRFANTRSLRIEHKEKGQHAVYKDLILRGRDLWEAYGQDEERAHSQLMADCGQEVKSLTACLQVVNAFGALPRLEAVAVGSIYGARSTTWDLYANQERDPGSIGSDDDRFPYEVACIKAFDVFLASCPYLQHFCLRDTYDPLSTLGGPHASYRGHRPYQITIHVPSQSIQPLPLALGASKTRYCFDSPTETDWAINLEWVEKELRGESGFRKSQRDAHAAHSPKCTGICAGPPANIEVFNSASLLHGQFNPTLTTFNLPRFNDGRQRLVRTLTIADQTKMVNILGNNVQAFMRRDSGVQDVVKWRRSDETPICEACGTGPRGRLQGWTPEGEEQE